MIGAPVFLREILSHSRKARTYVFQTVFLAVLVLCLVPLWPAGGSASGAAVADRGRLIFEYGGYLQVILLALLAPAITANAITEEKSSNTLDLLLLTGAGPFAIVLGKFISRLFILLFLLFLTVPILFALLTLGGVSARTIGIELAILVSFAVFAAALGVFLSTLLPRTTGVLLGGYAILGLLLASPAILFETGLVPSASASAGQSDLAMAYMSPLYDMMYLFQPSQFVATESVPSSWWVTPLWSVAGGLVLVLAGALILPYAREIEGVFNLRKALDAIDRLSFLLLSPRRLFAALRLKGRGEAGQDLEEAVRPAVADTNPVYWKETNVNTVGRFRIWWRLNLAVLGLLIISYWPFAELGLLSEIEFHQVVVAILAGVIAILSTVIAATTVSSEREDGTLVLLATTPVECATYVEGKLRGIGRNIAFLVALPFLHVAIFTIAGVITPWTLVFLLLTIPVAAAASIVQGIFVSLLFPTTLRAIVAGIILLIIEAALPLVCCLPGFNLPLACYYMVGSASGLSQPGTGGGASFTVAMLMASIFSSCTQLGYTFVVYSLIRSGFDGYIGRAA